MQQRRQCQADKEQGHVGLGLLTVDRPDRPPPLRRHQLRRCSTKNSIRSEIGHAHVQWDGCY